MSRGTVQARVDQELNSIKPIVRQMCQTLCSNGGGLTLDFAKKNVDYLVVTAHYINDRWDKVNFVLAFVPVPDGLEKTCNNVRQLVRSELEGMDIREEDMNKLYITTDEGSNVAKIGGEKHVPCACHIGATMAKRCTQLYSSTTMSNQVQNACREVNDGLIELERLVRKLR